MVHAYDVTTDTAQYIQHPARMVYLWHATLREAEIQRSLPSAFKLLFMLSLGIPDVTIFPLARTYWRYHPGDHPSFI